MLLTLSSSILCSTRVVLVFETARESFLVDLRSLELRALSSREKSSGGSSGNAPSIFDSLTFNSSSLVEIFVLD